MEENIEKTSNYELGFHIIPDLDETELQTSFNSLVEQVNKLGGSIVSTKEPKKQRLSYPINHKKQSYFGTVDLKGKVEIVDKLNQELKLNNNVMRYIILKHEENEKVLRPQTGKDKPRMKTHSDSPVKKDTEKEVKSEDIEKQLEEVIGNL